MFWQTRIMAHLGLSDAIGWARTCLHYFSRSASGLQLKSSDFGGEGFLLVALFSTMMVQAKGGTYVETHLRPTSLIPESDEIVFG